ncbi:hypothetical protein IMSAGC020_00951 [Lachnospiraceae bacterium]|nr:hypothetical protein IMSAGC020_00951 [Lachnospiraceae bacterium]
MKRRIANIILTSVLVAVIGCNASTASTSNVSRNDIIIDNVGIGIMQMVKDSIRVHHSKTQEDFDSLTSVIENRNDRIIIEMIDATVLDDDGNGSDSFGFYVKYDSGRYSKGDKVRSIFVYNPDTNYFDDIVCRVDALIE